MNSKGPNIDPCGTPMVRGVSLDRQDQVSSSKSNQKPQVHVKPKTLREAFGWNIK